MGADVLQGGFICRRYFYAMLPALEIKVPLTIEESELLPVPLKLSNGGLSSEGATKDVEIMMKEETRKTTGSGTNEMGAVCQELMPTSGNLWRWHWDIRIEVSCQCTGMLQVLSHLLALVHGACFFHSRLWLRISKTSRD